MSRKISWGVVAGATLLFALTGCATQSPADATPSGSADTAAASSSSSNVCAVLAAPVTAALVQNGITATPVNDGGADGCKWEDAGSGTDVTLKVGGSAPSSGQTQDVPGLGQATVVGPGELAFTVNGVTYDLTVSSPAADDVDSATATKVADTIGSTVAGLGGAGASAAPSDGSGATSDSGGQSGSGDGSGGGSGSDSADTTTAPTGS